jgi:putative ATP-dependent endonuclease of OLD family
VITDGDPRFSKAKNKTLKAGLRRGSRLLDKDSELKKLAELAAQDDEAKLAAALLSYGVFVGENTLELDLLTEFAGEMKETFRELINSEEKSKAFDAATAAASADPAQAQAILNRIEAVGKGRFAQRLAGKLKDKNPPDYILNAISFIIDRVKPADAKLK